MRGGGAVTWYVLLVRYAGVVHFLGTYFWYGMVIWYVELAILLVRFLTMLLRLVSFFGASFGQL